MWMTLLDSVSPCSHSSAYVCIRVHSCTGIYTVCVCARMGVCVHVPSYVCIYRCTCVHVYMCVCVCVCKRPHNSPTSSLTSPPPPCTHKLYLPKCPRPAPPNLGPSTQTLTHLGSPSTSEHTDRQTEGTRGGAGRGECKANHWKMGLFICMARICL